MVGNQLDFIHLSQEAMAFRPGLDEITQDDLDRRVLNLWRAPPITEQLDAPEPAPFIDHVRYLLDDDELAINHVMDFVAHLVRDRRSG